METIQLIVLALTIAINLFFAVVVFNQNKKSETNIYFSLLLASVCVWATANYIYNLPNISYDTVVFWMRIVFVATTPLIFFILLFAFSYPKPRSPIKTTYKILIALPSILLTILSLTDQIISGAKIDGNVAIPIFGNGIWIFFIYIVIYVPAILVVLQRNYHKAKGLVKSQLQFLFIGFCLFLLPATFTNLIMVVLFKSTALAPFGPTFSLFLAFFTTYAIIRHRLFSLTNLFNSTISVLINTAILHILYYGTTFFYITVFGAVFTPPVYIIGIGIGIFSSIFIWYVFSKSNKAKFIQKKFDPELYIQTIKNKDYIDLKSNEILTDFINTTENMLGIKKIQLYPNKENSEYEDLFNTYSNDEILLQKSFYLTQENNNLQEYFKDNNDEISGIILLVKEKKLLYLLVLSHRENYRAFNSEDIRVVNEAIDRLNFAISRSLLTDEQRRFNEVLQQKLDVATEELRKQKDEVEDRYRTEKDMVGIMGHELRTPLTTARGFLEIILTKAKANPNTPVNSYQHYLDNIYDAFKREVDLVQTMLSTSHVDNNKLKLDLVEVDLEGIIKGTIQDFLPDAEKKSLGFEYHPMENLPHIKSDPSRTIEVTNNLVSNAVKYTPKGRVDIYVSYDDQFVYFSVKDTGEGIPPEEIPNIGKRFYRVQNYLSADQTIVRPGGTGLGMYIVKAILAAAGGELRIESTVGQGSTFTAVFVRWDGK